MMIDTKLCMYVCMYVYVYMVIRIIYATKTLYSMIMMGDDDEPTL